MPSSLLFIEALGTAEANDLHYAGCVDAICEVQTLQPFLWDGTGFSRTIHIQYAVMRVEAWTWRVEAQFNVALPAMTDECNW